MSAPAGYRIVRRLQRRKGMIISRAVRLEDERSVIIKQLRRNECSREELSRLRHEYELLGSLEISGVVRPLALLSSDSELSLVFEDAGAVPLRQLMAERELDWAQWLPIAIRIGDLLGRVHEARVIHKQINPDHILIHPTTLQPFLIGFGYSTRLSREQPNWHPRSFNASGLAYIAPEQTGRINRTVDYRTDYYGLGATLYELMTGRPPFLDSQEMELIHHQIARQPRPPHRINPRLPEMVSQIILKLLAKDAAQRYQSTVGLIHDLRQCQQDYAREHQIRPFTLAEQDISARFQIPQRLYGRDAVLRHLRDLLDRQPAVQPPLVMISGYAGVGKSSLVHELRQSINERGGHFCSGKFDQYRRNRPYFAIVQALQGLVRQLLTEPEAEINRLRDTLQESLRGQGEVLLKLIPELELIIGLQPPLAPVTPAEEQRRFSRLFFRVLNALATPERPLVLFLDDLHWADLASLQLIETLTLNQDAPELMLMGSFRDQELGPAHPLTTTLDRLRQRQTPLLEIHLEPLTPQQISLLLADTLRCEPQQCHTLAQICSQKTQGNPFFLSQFLYALHEDGLIRFRDQRWQWDEAAIQAQEMTDNVVALMVSKIQRLPRSTQAVLPLAACIGATFNLRTLAVVSAQEPTEVSNSLWPAMTEGLLLPLDDQYQLFEQIDPNRARYRFIHDRVQQAAYSLIPDTELESLHLQVGRQLQQSLTEEEIDTRIFEITNHLNLAAGLIQPPDERLALAELNRRAARRARESAAFDAAMEYLKAGLALLPADSWHSHYSLTLALHSMCAEVANIRGDQALMTRSIEAVETQAQHLLDKVGVGEVRIQSLVARNQFAEALTTALSLLRQLGVNLPEHPSPLQLSWTANRIRWLLKRTPPERVPLLPPMHSRPLKAAMPILASMFGAVKFSSSDLRPLVMAKQVELTLSHGLGPSSALAFAGYGGVLCGQLEAFDQGYRLGQLALELDGQMAACSTHHRTLTLFNSYIRHYREPLSQCLESLLEAHQLALDCGDVEWSAYALAAYIQYAFELCSNLDQLQPRLEQYTAILRSSGQQQSLQYSLFVLQTMDNLRGQNADPVRLEGRFYQEEQDLKELEQENHRTAICLHHYYKAWLCYLFGDYEQALAHSEAGLQLRSSILATFTDPLLHWLHGLSLLALLPNTSLLLQPSRLKRVRRILRFLRRLERHAPANQTHHCALLQAELARSQRQYNRAMDLYEQAIEHARAQRYVFEQALACELAGQFYLDWHKPGIARTYLQDAYHQYSEWGARAKLRQMRQRYPFDFEQTRTEPLEAPIASPAPSAELDHQAFDISAVIHASQAISDEIVLERLLDRLMQLAIQNAGAQRAVLVMNRQQQLYIEAESCIDRAPTLFSACPLDQGEQQLPVSIIHYVARTKDPVVLGNAVEHQMFQQDLYIRQHRPRSLLSIPILYHGELTGILYLEHRESREVFSRERLKTLQILAAQAAISIENAKLYKSLEQSEREYRSLFENASEGIFRIDRDGHFISANPALVQLLGYPDAEQFLSQAPDLLRDCFVEASAGKTFLRTLNAGERVSALETRWQRRDGSTVFVAISAHRISDEQDQQHHYEGSLTDISERKAKEQAELARQKAEAASEAKSQFLATMSHEIRTPMNGILGMAQLLQRGALDEAQRQQVGSIYRSGQSLLSILNDVLDFTKIEAGQMTFEQEPFELRPLLEQLRVLLTPMAREKQLDLILRLDPALPAWVSGDARTLNQVLLNLCTNALKFTAEGFVVLKARPITPHPDGACWLRFEVEDSGIGIAPEAQERIFQHFSQADSSITRRYGGTGLGLSICKKLVEQQQGRIGFESQSGQGCLFWVELAFGPVATDQNTQRLGAPLPAPSRQGRPLDILLVEDTEINQAVTAGLLESEGHRVSIADDGYTALSMHNDHDYDLVLMDIHLPDMDGIETTRRLRQHRQRHKALVPVVALTAAVTPSEIRAYQAEGFAAVLGKPLRFEELERVLGQIEAAHTSPTPAEPPRPLSAEHTSTARAATLLDQALLRQHRQMLGDERMQQLIQTMQTQCSALLNTLPQANAEQRTGLLHKLAGASANFGLQELAVQCRRLERADQITTADIDQLQQLWLASLNALGTELPRTEPATLK